METSWEFREITKPTEEVLIKRFIRKIKLNLETTN